MDEREKLAQAVGEWYDREAIPIIESWCETRGITLGEINDLALLIAHAFRAGSRFSCADLRTRLERAEAERDKLQAFKTWTHTYLDAHGVPHHPPGAHGAEGCRIGDRLDWLLECRERARELETALRRIVERIPGSVASLMRMSEGEMRGMLAGVRESALLAGREPAGDTK